MLCVFVGLVTAWLCLGPASVSATGDQDRPCSKALHHDSMVQLSIGDSRCTCLAGYQLVSDNADNSIGGDNTWWCEPCAAGFFKATKGLQACTPCETKNMWSAAGQTACVACGASSMVTTQTLHTVCVPCPSEMSTLVRYIDNQQLTNKAMPFPGPDSVSPARTMTLYAGNMAEFSAVYVVNSNACLSPSDVVENVEEMLTLRTVCPRGTHMMIAESGTRDDVDTECVSCGPGTYNDEIGASVCKAVTPCTDARHVDASGREEDSTCTLDWAEAQIVLGEYPVLPAESSEEYEFDAHRTVSIFDYTSCISSTVDQQLLIKKCGSWYGRCVHDLTGSWQRGVVVLANVVALCQYRCKPGYYLSLGKCEQCAAGTHKNEDMPEDAVCVLCDAGKHRSNSDVQEGKVVCSACETGKFATTTRTTCEDTCTTDTEYADGHVCFRATPSYLITLPPAQQTLRVNVEPCPVAAGTTTAVVGAVTVVTYSNEGVLSCDAHPECGSAEQSVEGTCRACPNDIEHAESGVFLHQCMPSCKQQYHPVRKNAGVPPSYTCEQCGHDIATFVLQKCAFADYLADTCSEHNKNTPCLPCSALQKQHQIHDVGSVQIDAFDRDGRCKFKCRNVQVVQNKNWYFVDISTAADMLGIGQQELRTRLTYIDGGAQVCAFFFGHRLCAARVGVQSCLAIKKRQH